MNLTYISSGNLSTAYQNGGFVINFHRNLTQAILSADNIITYYLLNIDVIRDIILYFIFKLACSSYLRYGFI